MGLSSSQEYVLKNWDEILDHAIDDDLIRFDETPTEYTARYGQAYIDYEARYHNGYSIDGYSFFESGRLIMNGGDVEAHVSKRVQKKLTACLVMLKMGVT